MLLQTYAIAITLQVLAFGLGLRRLAVAVKNRGETLDLVESYEKEGLYKAATGLLHSGFYNILKNKVAMWQAAAGFSAVIFVITAIAGFSVVRQEILSFITK